MHNIFQRAYRKTGTRDPSGTLAEPYKNRKTGTLAGPYKNRKTGTLAGPYKTRKNGTLAGPNKNWKTGTLARPYKNRKTRTRDLSETLKKPGIHHNSISFKICKVNVKKCKYFQKLEINSLSLSFSWSLDMHFTNTFHSFHKTSG